MHTLQPADLSSRTVSLLVLSCDAEDYSGPCRTIDVRVVQLGFADCARCLCTAIDSDEGQLTGFLCIVPFTLPHS